MLDESNDNQKCVFFSPFGRCLISFYHEHKNHLNKNCNCDERQHIKKRRNPVRIPPHDDDDAVSTQHIYRIYVVEKDGNGMKKRASKVKIPLLMKINNDAKAEKEAEQNPKKKEKRKK